MTRKQCLETGFPCLLACIQACFSWVCAQLPQDLHPDTTGSPSRYYRVSIQLLQGLHLEHTLYPREKSKWKRSTYEIILHQILIRGWQHGDCSKIHFSSSLFSALFYWYWSPSISYFVLRQSLYFRLPSNSWSLTSVEDCFSIPVVFKSFDFMKAFKHFTHRNLRNKCPGSCRGSTTSVCRKSAGVCPSWGLCVLEMCVSHTHVRAHTHTF